MKRSLEDSALREYAIRYIEANGHPPWCVSDLSEFLPMKVRTNRRNGFGGKSAIATPSA
jgi:hypothetical protein